MLHPVPSADAPEPYEELPSGFAHFNAHCRATNTEFCQVALDHLVRAGARVEQFGGRLGEFQVAGVVRSGDGTRYVVLAHGTFDDGPRAGFCRSDTVKKAGFDAVMLARRGHRVLLVTSHLPADGACAAYLRDLGGDVDDVVACEGDLAGFQRLVRLFGGHRSPAPAPAPWRRDPGPQLELFTPGGTSGA